MDTEETLVEVYAQTYAWHVASVRPGDRDGAAEVAEDYSRDGAIPFHVEHGARRQRETLLRELSQAGLLLVSGNTQARRCGLTWAGVCRAVALTVGRGEIVKAFAVLDAIADYAKHAGGPDVSPSGSVPEYLLAPELGYWWKDCAPGKAEIMLARARLFDEALPALAMRWLTVAADCHGRRWFMLTATGKAALKVRPATPRGLPEDTLTDFYLAEGDKAWETACQAKPRDGNAVHIGVSASRSWTPKGGTP